jgi:hypothetical protein
MGYLLLIQLRYMTSFIAIPGIPWRSTQLGSSPFALYAESLILKFLQAFPKGISR